MIAYATAAADSAGLSRATEAQNRMMWDGASAGHYEVWYLTGNHRPSKTGFWIRSTLESPLHGAAYAQVWFAFFDAVNPAKNFAINRKFPIGDLHAEGSPFRVTIAGNEFTHGSLRGALAGGGHDARWDLSWLPAAETHRHLPGVIYRTKFADSRVLSPSLDVPLRGKIVVDGRELVLEGEPGGQTHVWGRKHLYSWAWGHCNAFDARRGAALETLCMRLKRRGVVLPALTMTSLYLDGEPLQFNDFKDVLRARGAYGTARYQFSSTGAHARLEGEYTCRPEDMVTAEYHDPDGEPAYCANTEVADLRITVWRRDRVWQRWREQARLYAPQTGHFEVGARTPDPAILKRHETV